MPAVKHARKINTPTTEFVPRAPAPVPVEGQAPKARWITVTPEVAAMWLAETNTKNRAIREPHALRLASDMTSGKWRGRNGEPIRFDINGRLVDGQHRLRACVLSGVSFETLLITDVTPEDYLTIGIGMRKSVGDLIGPMNGEKNAHLLSAALRLVYMWGQGTLGKSEKGGAAFPTVAAMEEVYRNHPNLSESVARIANSGSIRRLLTPSYAVLIHYAGTLENKHATVDSFLDRLGSGLGLLDNDPVYHLRSFLLSQRGPTAGHRRAGRIYTLAMTVKAWNASKNGQSVKRLTWVASEGFPQL